MKRTRIPSKLTNIEVKNAKPKDKPYKLSDGGGLYLLVGPSGSKSWKMKYRYRGKEKALSIGVYPVVSLAEARKITNTAREDMDEGKDPVREKKLKKLKQDENLFEDIAEQWWEKEKGGWTEDHARRVWISIEKEILPEIGEIAIFTITTPECLDVIRKVEARGALDVASRVKQRMTAIFNYAIQIGKANQNPVIHLTDVIKVRKTKHMKALDKKELPKFLKSLDTSSKITDVVRYALQLDILTFTRPGEIRLLEWVDINFEKKEWRIPEEKTKMKREHVVPLSNQAITVLEKVKKISEDFPYVFPGYHDHQKPISENTLTHGIRKRLKFDATAHGMRTLASTTLNEKGFSPDAIERQLSHVEENKIRLTYNKYEYIKERVEMMQWWGNYLDKQKKKYKGR